MIRKIDKAGNTDVILHSSAIPRSRAPIIFSANGFLLSIVHKTTAATEDNSIDEYSSPTMPFAANCIKSKLPIKVTRQ